MTGHMPIFYISASVLHSYKFILLCSAMYFSFCKKKYKAEKIFGKNTIQAAVSAVVILFRSCLRK